MKQNVDNLLQKNRELDPFYKRNNFRKCVDEAHWELREVIDCFAQESNELAEELGDLYRSVWRTLMKAEDSFLGLDTIFWKKTHILNMSRSKIITSIDSLLNEVAIIDNNLLIAQKLIELSTYTELLIWVTADLWLIKQDEAYIKNEKKMQRRKPYLLTWEEVTEKEAMDFWNTAKAAEWKSNLWDEARSINKN